MVEGLATEWISCSTMFPAVRQSPSFLIVQSMEELLSRTGCPQHVGWRYWWLRTTLLLDDNVWCLDMIPMFFTHSWCQILRLGAAGIPEKLPRPCMGIDSEAGFVCVANQLKLSPPKKWSCFHPPRQFLQPISHPPKGSLTRIGNPTQHGRNTSGWGFPRSSVQFSSGHLRCHRRGGTGGVHTDQSQFVTQVVATKKPWLMTWDPSYCCLFENVWNGFGSCMLMYHVSMTNVRIVYDIRLTYIARYELWGSPLSGFRVR